MQMNRLAAMYAQFFLLWIHTHRYARVYVLIDICFMYGLVIYI